MKNTPRRAALYLRSSKDRNDVSIDAQRRELRKLATSESIVVVEEYADAVESAKDERRSGFQRLLHDLKSSTRAWDTLMMVDTSRLSRRRYMAQVFKHEARKRAVQIIYSKLPESDPIADMVVIGVMEVFDELHSLMSKEKGLAGMAENVRQGFRAGGRAPKGYKLVKLPTGATRDGEAVTKTKLEPNEDAPVVSRYLKMRAGGTSRKGALEQLALPMAKSSAIGLEWNALTYAGHTVWNVHNETTGSGYKGGTKRRPREEWVIRENTHEALITSEEAEFILARLEASPHAKRRKHPSSYLLTGLLKTPQGESWFGNGRGGYIPRGTAAKKNRKVDQTLLEEAVLGQVMSDLRSETFIKTLTREAIKYREAHSDDPAKSFRKKLNDVETRIGKMMMLAADMDDPAPALREVDALERHRNSLAAEVSRREQEYTAASLLDNITEGHVKTLLGGIAENIDATNRETLKDFLSNLIDRVTLDPVSHECQVDYRISMDLRNKVASPTGFEPVSPP